MRFRKLRIAWSVGWGIAAVLLLRVVGAELLASQMAYTCPLSSANRDFDPFNNETPNRNVPCNGSNAVSRQPGMANSTDFQLVAADGQIKTWASAILQTPQTTPFSFPPGF